MIFRRTVQVLHPKAVLNCNQNHTVGLEQFFKLIQKIFIWIIRIRKARCVLEHAVKYDIIEFFTETDIVEISADNLKIRKLAVSCIVYRASAFRKFNRRDLRCAPAEQTR